MINSKVFPKSGDKIIKKNGIRAIKNGQKNNKNFNITRGEKPSWLRFISPGGSGFNKIRDIVRNHNLSTVCEEAMCPNIGECWNAGTATIMLLGSVCTRACRFCAVDTGNPRKMTDIDEPLNSAMAVKKMGLKYVVLTSVNRDDLPDGGADHYARTVLAIKQANPQIHVEVLTPDFQGNKTSIEILLNSQPTVFAQNIETIERLTEQVRDRRSGYQQTLAVLLYAKQNYPHILTKTSIIVGLGETNLEIYRILKDIRKAKVDIVTLGQYLRPTKNHLPIERYVTPREFSRFRSWGLKLGFMEVIAGPMVRSSYRAEQVLGLRQNKEQNHKIPLLDLTKTEEQTNH